MFELLKNYIRSIIVENKLKNFVSVGLLFRAKNDDESKGIIVGEKFVVDSIGQDCVILKRQFQKTQLLPDSYNSSTFIVSFDELENGFDLA